MIIFTIIPIKSRIFFKEVNITQIVVLAKSCYFSLKKFREIGARATESLLGLQKSCSGYRILEVCSPIGYQGKTVNSAHCD